MPDTLSLSTGVSFGLVAGIVSGVCYLLANGLSWSRDQEERKKYSGECVAAAEKFVCRRCGGDKLGGVIPCICHNHKPVKFESGAWFLRQVQRALSLMPWSISTDKLEQIDEECESAGPSEGGDLRSVREFLEALSAKLAGGPLEGTRVAPLYHHPAYVGMFVRHHSMLSSTLAVLAAALQDALAVSRKMEQLYNVAYK